jgi:predicted transcriptional regulator
MQVPVAELVHNIKNVHISLKSNKAATMKKLNYLTKVPIVQFTNGIKQKIYPVRLTRSLPALCCS